MAKFNVVDMNGQRVSEIELSDAVFGITPNEKDRKSTRLNSSHSV